MVRPKMLQLVDAATARSLHWQCSTTGDLQGFIRFGVYCLISVLVNVCI